MSADSVEKDFRKGKKFLREDNVEMALRFFDKAFRNDRNRPEHMSYYGMCVALRYGEIGLGLELCTKAIKKEFFRSEFYVNLGKVYMAAGNKKGAMNALKKGLRFDPDSIDLIRLLEEIGVRNRPLIPFLGRTNPLNRFLGNLFRRRIPDLFRKKGPREGLRWDKGKA